MSLRLFIRVGEVGFGLGFVVYWSFYTCSKVRRFLEVGFLFFIFDLKFFSGF